MDDDSKLRQVCADFDHPYDRDDVVGETGSTQVRRVGRCWCGDRIYPAGGE